MILSVLAATPLVGALVVTLMPRTAAAARAVKVVALATSLVALALALYVTSRFDVGAGG